MGVCDQNRVGYFWFSICRVWIGSFRQHPPWFWS